MEQWKDFLDGYYQVSNLGNVRRAKDGENTFAGRNKSLCVNSSGYHIIGANISGKRTNVYVHRAVVEAFLGEIPENYVVNHIDGNKTNNRVENLEIVSVSGNSIHALKNGLNKLPTSRATGENHWTKKHPDKVKRGAENGAALHPEKIWRGSQCKISKLTENQVIEIKKRLATGEKDKDISADFGVSRENISAIKRGKTWNHITV